MGVLTAILVVACFYYGYSFCPTMGVLTAILVVACLYYGSSLAVKSLLLAADALMFTMQALCALGRIFQVLSHPPGSSLYSGPPTLWHRCWHLLTWGPLRARAGPGTFLRAYSLLLAPAAAVAAVALLSLAARSPAAAELAAAVYGSRRPLGGLAAGVLAVVLAEDAVRRLLLAGRLFPAALRGSGALGLGFTALLLGLPEAAGGLSPDQAMEWGRALLLLSAAGTAAVGGGTLLATAVAAGLQGAVGQHTAGAAGAEPLEPTDRLACLLYGGLLLAAAAAATSAYTGGTGPLLLRLGRRLLRLLDAVVGAAPLLGRVARGVKAALRLAPVRAATRAFRSADRVLTAAVAAALARTCGVLADVWGRARSLRAVLHGWFTNVTTNLAAPLGRAVAAGLRAAAAATRAAATETYHRGMLPAARALRSAAATAYTSLLRPAALTLATCLRLYVAPVMWPAGAVTSLYWFVRQAVQQRAVLPYGAAAYVSALVVGLMAGKAMRKSRQPHVARLGARLESLSAAAYLRIDPGVSRLAARTCHLAFSLAAMAFLAALSTGRWALALLSAPFFAALGVLLTGLAWAMEAAVWVGSPVAAALRAGVVAVWRRPEAALVLAAAVVAGAYGAHVAGGPAATWRAAVWAVTASGSIAARMPLLLLSPFLRLVSAAAARLLPLLGLSARAAADTSAALAGWGSRAATDAASLFASRSFAGAFLGLHVLHAALLRGWALPALGLQGDAGRAATTSVVSFVARSTCKVALGPLYLTSAASFLLPGWVAGGVAARLAALGAPVLWLAYLAAMWVEGALRVNLSYDTTDNSEFSRTLRELRAGRQPRPRSQLQPHTRHDTPRGDARTAAHPTPAATSSTATAAAIGEVRTAAAAAADSAGATAAGGLDARALQLLEDLRSQGPPSHVFHTDSCAVCMEEVAADDITAAAAASGAVHGGSSSGSGHGGRVGSDSEAREGGAGPQGRGQECASDGVGEMACGSGGAGGYDGAAALQVLRCGHVYHTTCILLWLQRNGRCPVCRELAVGRGRHANMLF